MTIAWPQYFRPVAPTVAAARGQAEQLMRHAEFERHIAIENFCPEDGLSPDAAAMTVVRNSLLT
jgi:hypothetical protein